MSKNKTVIIIPARGGSKSIHKKNLHPILGKPLVVWTIESALDSQLADRVIVSTDDKEIANVAKKHGAEIPFLRPKELAEDDVPDLPVFQHALNWLKKNENYIPDFIVHLWPTSPLREYGSIDEAIRLLEKTPGTDAVRSVTLAQETPFKMWRLDKGKFLHPILKAEYQDLYQKNETSEPHTLPRQQLPPIYVQTGYLSVIRYQTIMKMNSMQGKNILPYIHDPENYTELDSHKDLFYTKHILKNYLNDKK